MDAIEAVLESVDEDNVDGRWLCMSHQVDAAWSQSSAGCREEVGCRTTIGGITRGYS